MRPSLVSCIAHAPLPGYCGNLAGPNGICAAIAAGFYNSTSAVPFQPNSTWDIVAADYVAGTIISAAAVTAVARASSLAATAAAAAAAARDYDNDDLTIDQGQLPVAAGASAYIDASCGTTKLDQRVIKIPCGH